MTIPENALQLEGKGKPKLRRGTTAGSAARILTIFPCCYRYLVSESKSALSTDLKILGGSFTDKTEDTDSTWWHGDQHLGCMLGCQCGQLFGFKAAGFVVFHPELSYLHDRWECNCWISVRRKRPGNRWEWDWSMQCMRFLSACCSLPYWGDFQWLNRQTIVGLQELKHLKPETKLNSDSGYIATVAGVSKCVTEIEGKICWTKRVTHQGMGAV